MSVIAAKTENVLLESYWNILKTYSRDFRLKLAAKLQSEAEEPVSMVSEEEFKYTIR